MTDGLRGVPKANVTSVGKEESILRNLQRIRSSVMNPDPEYIPSLRLSRRLTVTHDGQDFLQYYPALDEGSVLNEDIIAFFSDEDASALEQNHHWAIDGTFDIIAKPYKQLVTIGTLQNDHFIPKEYFILKNKTEASYLGLFRILLRSNYLFQPRTINCDFEMAIMNAIQFHFPRTAIQGCFFHLNQNIIKYVQRNGLAGFYRADDQVKKYVRGLAALSFVDERDVLTNFDLLRESADFPTMLEELYDYFFLNYIGDESRPARYDRSFSSCMRSQESGLPRTNNSIERLHSILSRQI